MSAPATARPSKLAQLRDMTVVVADTGDAGAIERLKPVDCTTNPTLVRKALDLPVYAPLIERELERAATLDGDVEQVARQAEIADQGVIRLGNGAQVQVLDVRSPEEVAQGRVPGAEHAFVAHLPDGLGQLDRSRTVATYCGSGVQASHLALAISAAGLGGQVPVYIGSWSDWITDPTRPIATGP